MTILTRWRLALGAARGRGRVSAVAGAQLPGVPGGGSVPSVPSVGGTLGNAGRDRPGRARPRPRASSIRSAPASAELAQARVSRLEELVRANRDRLEMTDLGPAVRGQVIAIDPDPAALAAAERAGFTRIAEERIEGLDIRSVTLARAARLVGRPGAVAAAAARARRASSPPTICTARAATRRRSPARRRCSPRAAGRGRRERSGSSTAASPRTPSLRGPVQQRGFAAGAPRPSGHGTAIASLVAGQGPVRGAAPGAPLLVADVYGGDPAGGNALALARALGWMVAQRVPVVAVSLVGPANRSGRSARSARRGRGAPGWSPRSAMTAAPRRPLIRPPIPA